MKRNKGFGIIEVTLIFAVIAIAGFVGYKAVDMLSKDKTPDITQTAQVNTDQAPAVTEASDLDKSTATLDAVDIDSTEAAQVDLETTF